MIGEIDAPSGYISRQCCVYVPFLTFVMSVSLVVLHYTLDQEVYDEMKYGGFSIETEWYTPFTYTLLHANDPHLYANLTLLVSIGMFYELTEGFWRMLLLWWISGAAGAAMHSILHPQQYCVGASGVIYGLTCCQISILVLNWSEMPLRWIRLIYLIFLFLMETILYNVSYRPNVSYGAHWGGALSAVLAGLIISVNIRLRWFEILIHWICLLCFTGIVGWFYLESLYGPASLCAVTVPFLLTYTLQTTVGFRNRFGRPSFS